MDPHPKERRPLLRVDIVTLFPEYFEFPLRVGPVRRAREQGTLEVRLLDLRSFADSPKEVDDYPYGGGAGMVLKPEPLVRAIESVRGPESLVILFSPQGERLNHARVKELATKPHLILLCGRYKGVDERVRRWVDLELSIGDYVLSGGEPAALVLLDAVARWLPESLGDKDSALTDSFETGLLDAPLYTRPPEFRGLRVPEVLRSGNHAQIRRWRRKQSLLRTLLRRPDLLERYPLSEEDRKLLQEALEEYEGQASEEPSPEQEKSS